MSPKEPWILLLDDDPEFCAALAVFFQRLGIELHATQTTEEFTKTIKDHLPTVCLVDLNLNGTIAGFSMVKALRSRFGMKLPLIIISATNDIPAITHAIQCGADDYIVKPVDLHSLKEKLSRFIKIGAKAEEERVLIKTPAGGIDCLLGFEIKLKSIDELGVRVYCPHFLCKGAPTYLSGSILEEAFPGRKKILSTVLDCQPQPDGTFLLILEFAELTPEDQSGLRKFITLHL